MVSDKSLFFPGTLSEYFCVSDSRDHETPEARPDAFDLFAAGVSTLSSLVNMGQLLCRLLGSDPA